VNNFIERLKRCKSILEIFDLVKTCVEKVLNLSRGGIMIGLQDLPNYILSYHPIGSNIIVLNKRTLSKIAYIIEDQETLNSLLFYLILCEYLRSLGIINEKLARDYASKICERIFGDEHILTFIVKNGLDTIIPELNDNTVSTDYFVSDDILILKETQSRDLLYI